LAVGSWQLRGAGGVRKHLGDCELEHIFAARPLKLRVLNGRFSAALLPVVAACLLGACTGSAPPKVAATPTAPRPAPQLLTLQDRGWGVLRSEPLGLKLALPEARSWFEPNRRAPGGAGWELRHEPTGSTLSVRRWRASRLPRVDSCEAELRGRTPDLATLDETNLVAQREVRVPEGFVTRITLLALPGNGTRLRGQVLAIGAGIGECLAAIARTECASEAELGERLRLLDVALGHLRLARIEDRVPAPLPLPHQ
jgi:hypothetical protein